MFSWPYRDSIKYKFNLVDTYIAVCRQLREVTTCTSPKDCLLATDLEVSRDMTELARVRRYRLRHNTVPHMLLTMREQDAIRTVYYLLLAAHQKVKNNADCAVYLQDRGDLTPHEINNIR